MNQDQAPPMDPGEVREQFLEMTAELKELVRTVEGDADRVLDGDERAIPTLHRHAQELKTAVAYALDATDTVLAPTLATIDAWGSVRRDRIVEAATSARQGIQAAERKAESARSPHELAMAVRTLLAHVLRLVRREDLEALRTSVLDESRRAAEQFTG
jgi:hypothetical protein